VPTHRTSLAVLTTGVLALGAGSAAAAKPAPCRAPDTGYQSCLRVLYKPGKAGAVEHVRITATLVRDGDELATVRRAGRCAKGVMTWRVQLDTGRTRGWELRAGDTVTASWSGLRRTSSVRIQPR
jgi:hypothetical protein